MQVPNSFFYQFTDNQSINLLELEYSDYRRTYTKEISDGIGRISFTSERVGEYIKIRWQDKIDNSIKSEKISLKQGLPFNMREAKVRLTFNKDNQPEVYVFHENPGSHKFFWFKGHPYSGVFIRQIHPINQKIEIDFNQKYE